MFGEGLSLLKRRAQEVPGPQPKHRGKGMFIKPAFPAQLKCSRVSFLYVVRTPAFDSSEGVAERRLQQQLKFIAEHRVVDARDQLQSVFQMTNGSIR